MEMGDSKILLHVISDLGDGLVPVYFVLRQFRTRDSLGHDAVGDFVHPDGLFQVDRRRHGGRPGIFRRRSPRSALR